MSVRLQLGGLIAMTMLAMAILFLIGHTFDGMLSQATPDGKVPLADAGLFTALLLSFREVLGVIKSLWEHQDRDKLTEALSNSFPPARADPATTDGEGTAP
ncbi:hypothetical protein DMC47_27630 [Nostoc sp. 3335mG]|nr:hypothetical protein DMC47_27630 [Nostoc sp. 3335mG]